MLQKHTSEFKARAAQSIGWRIDTAYNHQHEVTPVRS